MLDISFRSAQVRNVFRAVTVNGKSLLLTALLGLILIYLYAMLGLFFFQTLYPSDTCGTLFQCLLTTTDSGLRSGGGIGDVLTPVNFTESGLYAGAFFFHLSFFAIIIIIILNVVFGIILDAFGELRDERKDIEEDIKSKCFICAIDNDEFQRKAYGFKHHTKFDHNVWHYFYFLVYLETKNKDEYTSAEEYVAEKRKKDDIGYFPVGRALVLTATTQHEE